jgi:hypothetical protein
VNKLDQKDERVILGARTAYATFLLTALPNFIPWQDERTNTEHSVAFRRDAAGE